MSNISGKVVDCLRVIPGISSGMLSPQIAHMYRTIHKLGVQVRFIPDLSDRSTHYLSPSKFAFPPLIEHYFYPVSTAPINNPTKRKLKERY
jgi:hypothetical protein